MFEVLRPITIPRDSSWIASRFPKCSAGFSHQVTVVKARTVLWYCAYMLQREVLRCTADCISVCVLGYPVIK
jgi:hypothetical protein